MKRKPYKTIDDIPRGYFNLVIICLRRGRKEKASELLHKQLIQVKDCPQYEVFLLCRKLMNQAGVA